MFPSLVALCVSCTPQLYAPLNIFVTLVGVEVWTEFDEITLSEDASTTLENFMEYRREKLFTSMPNDDAQLLT